MFPGLPAHLGGSGKDALCDALRAHTNVDGPLHRHKISAPSAYRTEPWQHGYGVPSLGKKVYVGASCMLTSFTRAGGAYVHDGQLVRAVRSPDVNAHHLISSVPHFCGNKKNWGVMETGVWQDRGVKSRGRCYFGRWTRVTLRVSPSLEKH